jgi:hypothetical protein
MGRKIIKGIGITFAAAVIGLVIFVAVLLLDTYKTNQKRRDKRDERRAKLTEEFHRDMQQRFRLNPGDYTIVSDFFEVGSSYSLIRFKIRGEDQVREVKYNLSTGWEFKDMGGYPTPDPTPTEDRNN